MMGEISSADASNFKSHGDGSSLIVKVSLNEILHGKEMLSWSKARPLFFENFKCRQDGSEGSPLRSVTRMPFVLYQS